MHLSAICILISFAFSVFCHKATAFDQEENLKELMSLQQSMNKAKDEGNLTEAKKHAAEIRKLFAEFEAARTASVNAVPKDKPLPPAKKELVPVSQQQPVKEDVLKMYDKDKDGEITHEEFRGLWSGQFDYLDANRDGKLDRNEWRNPAFSGMDLDKSGFLERQEWMRYRDWCFSTFMDANKDGKAVPGEWK